MAILNGFKSYEKYVPVYNENGYQFQLSSEITHARDIMFDDGDSLKEKLQGFSIRRVTQDEYNNLVKDDSTIYLVID